MLVECIKHFLANFEWNLRTLRRTFTENLKFWVKFLKISEPISYQECE